MTGTESGDVRQGEDRALHAGCRDEGLPATTVDAFLGGALFLRQPVHGYRAGIDPVLLAAAAGVSDGEQVIDCGAGVGTVGLCLARRLAGVRVTLVEREPVYAALARENVVANDLAARVEVVEADLTARLASIGQLAPRIGQFDHALANPPFLATDSGTRSRDALKDVANAMPSEDLKAWARFMAAMLRPGGRLTLVHRADALGDLLDVLRPRFGAIGIRAVHPREGVPAHRLLLTAVQGSRGPLALLPPLVLHDPSGRYVPQVAAVSARPQALG